MKLEKFIKTTVLKYLKEQLSLNENENFVDIILDKIGKEGKQSLSYDERVYLKQYTNKKVNPNLEEWLFSEDDDTFDINGKKLLFDQYSDNEDIFYNQDKLKRVISKHLNKSPFTNNADWGGGYVWNVNSNDNFIGTFLYLDDDELIVLNRTLDDDEYDDDTIKYITNTKELYNYLASLNK